MADRPPPTVVPRTSRRARLPVLVRLPMLIVLNLCLQTALWTASNNVLGNELGKAHRRPRSEVPGAEETLWDVAVAFARHLGPKIAMISVAWELRYDFYDIGALTAVINIPYAFLLTTFYDVDILAAFTYVAIEVIAIALPTYLLRPIADVNNSAVPIRNRYMLNSFQVNMSNIALAVGVYATVLYSALHANWLTTYLVSHFEILSVEKAHDADYMTLIPKLLISGYATKSFLLNPSIASQPDTGAATPVGPFEPATATLPQTLKHNFWFFTRRTRTLIQRTIVLSVFLLTNTVLRGQALEGSEITGSAGYAGVWILSAVICAGWFAWTGDAEP